MGGLARKLPTMIDQTALRTSVLVVDDEPQVVWVLQFSLEAEGYTTYAARDGRQALTAIAEHHPKLMLLDLMMPTLDGWSVLEEMMQLRLDQGRLPRLNGRPAGRAAGAGAGVLIDR